MPAQSKYLSSKGQRAMKICTAVLGGYLLTAAFHLFLTSLPHTRAYFIILAGISFFVVWPSLMVLAFLVKAPWKTAVAYLILSLILFAFTWLVL